MKKPTIILIIIVVFIIAIAVLGVVRHFRPDTTNNGNDENADKLIKYTYSVSGDMRGSSYSEEIKPYDDTHALLIISSSEWHDEDEKTEEYLIDIGILDELKDAAKQYKMKNWDGKKITDVFVDDGPSYRYGFIFENDEFSFSSQYYPEQYAKGTKALKEVIDRYRASAEKLPGLVVAEKTDEERYRSKIPTEGEVTFEVYGYRDLVLRCRVLNGTDTAVTLSADLHVYVADTNTEIPSEVSKYTHDYEVGKDETRESSTTLETRLLPGKYILVSGNLTTEFEIR